MATWEEWVQEVVGGAVKGYTASRYEQPYELQRLKIQALADSGYLYTEGQAAAAGQGFSVPPGLLLMGGALLLAILILND